MLYNNKEETGIVQKNLRKKNHGMLPDKNFF
jgi:hypothetical protein